MTAAKNIGLSVINNSDAEIKITKVEYLDGGDWETENWLGVDGIQKIMPHQGIDFPRRNLERVGNKRIQIRLTWKEHLGGTKWGSDRCTLSGSFTAFDYFTVPIYVPSSEGIGE